MYFLNRQPLRGLDRQTNPPPPLNMIKPPFRSFLLFPEEERQRGRSKEKIATKKEVVIDPSSKTIYQTFQTFNRQTLNVCGVGGVPSRDSDRGNDFSTFSGKQEVRWLRERIGRLPDALDPALAPKLVENPATFSGSWTILVLNGDPHTTLRSCIDVRAVSRVHAIQREV